MSNFGLSQNINQFPIDPRAEWVSNGGSSTPNITNDTVGSIFEKEDVVTLNPKHPTSEQQAEQQFEALRKATEELMRLRRYNPLQSAACRRTCAQPLCLRRRAWVPSGSRELPLLPNRYRYRMRIPRVS